MNKILKYWDRIRYFKMAAPFMKKDVLAWWDSLEDEE